MGTTRVPYEDVHTLPRATPLAGKHLNVRLKGTTGCAVFATHQDEVHVAPPFEGMDPAPLASARQDEVAPTDMVALAHWYTYSGSIAVPLQLCTVAERPRPDHQSSSCSTTHGRLAGAAAHSKAVLQYTVTPAALAG